MTTPTPDELTGLRLPGGTSRVEAYENLLLHDAVRAPRSTRPHPIWAFLAPQRGMGLTLAALFERLGCPLDAERSGAGPSRLDSGPLLGRFAARFHGPFALDVDHRVRGGVRAVRRRRSRVLGVLDEVDLVLDLTGEDGTPVLTATYGFLLPRPEAPPDTVAPTSVAPAERPSAPADPAVGDVVGPPITVRADEMKLLALLLRDPNPIHIDAAVAVAQGHRACVNQGPANLAYALTFLTARSPDRTLIGFDARFRATVVDGDVVTPVVRDSGFALRGADGCDAVTGRAELATIR